MSYSWPGNIRELAAVIDRAAILGNGRGLEVAKSLGMTTGPSDMSPMNQRVRQLSPHVSPEIVSLDEANKRHIAAALTAARGIIKERRGAAALLKISAYRGLSSSSWKSGVERYRSPKLAATVTITFP
ncbi:MAG: AAA-type ATPase lid domain-containing protein [Pirellulaceae bacterium]